jgi:hypothetical protein
VTSVTAIGSATMIIDPVCRFPTGPLPATPADDTDGADAKRCPSFQTIRIGGAQPVCLNFLTYCIGNSAMIYIRVVPGVRTSVLSFEPYDCGFVTCSSRVRELFLKYGLIEGPWQSS